jgi:DNA polymerase-3 subunit epsilon
MLLEKCANDETERNRHAGLFAFSLGAGLQLLSRAVIDANANACHGFFLSRRLHRERRYQFFLTDASMSRKRLSPVNVLLLDTETTGLNPDQDLLIEVACTVYSVDHASPVESYSNILRAHSNAGFLINQIKPELLASSGADAESVLRRVASMAEHCEAFVAHRAEFDRGFMARAFGAYGLSTDKPWICSKTDLQYPNGRMGDHLVQLALGLGLGVCEAHRAAADVSVMSRIFTRLAEMGVPLEEFFRKGLRPKQRFVAHVSYEMRDVAKKAGFLWDGGRRQWYRHMPPEDVAALNFRAVQQD